MNRTAGCGVAAAPSGDGSDTVCPDRVTARPRPSCTRWTAWASSRSMAAAVRGGGAGLPAGGGPGASRVADRTGRRCL